MKKKIAIHLFSVLLIVFVASLGTGYAHFGSELNFKARLTGGEAVPPAKTMAGGEAVFKLGKDGKELAYTITVRGIEHVVAAHIHAGKKGKSGPPVVSLFTGPAKEGALSGTLVKGLIMENDLAGSLAGKPLSALIDLIKSGDAYVNVHTDKYPDGEIRGQITYVPTGE